MSKELIKINCESQRQFGFRLSLSEFSPIRKKDLQIPGDGKKDIEARSPITPGTLPNSTFRSFSAVVSKKKFVGFNKISEISSSIANLDLKIKNSLQILENTYKKNKELDQKIRILEQKCIEKKLMQMTENVNSGCSKNCTIW